MRREVYQSVREVKEVVDNCIWVNDLSFDGIRLYPNVVGKDSRICNPSIEKIMNMSANTT